MVNLKIRRRLEHAVSLVRLLWPLAHTAVAVWEHRNRPRSGLFEGFPAALAKLDADTRDDLAKYRDCPVGMQRVDALAREALRSLMRQHDPELETACVEAGLWDADNNVPTEEGCRLLMTGKPVPGWERVIRWPARASSRA